MKHFTMALLCLIITATTKAQVTLDSTVRKMIDSAVSAQIKIVMGKIPALDTLQNSPAITFIRNGKYITAVFTDTGLVKKISDAVSASATATTANNKADALDARVKALEAINIKVKAAY